MEIFANCGKFFTSGFCQRFSECDGISVTQALGTNADNLDFPVVYPPVRNTPIRDCKALSTLDFIYGLS